jgi:antitoxin PrlF
MITATITSKGQITIPAEVRLALKLGAGDRIAFEKSPTGGFVFSPVKKVSVTALKGLFGKPSKAVSIQDMNVAIANRGVSARLSSGLNK